ncbi:MAG: hypothetical protein DMF58_11480 [Acidobacteria bacterium]|nr:MAG: hypothetical protein DMF58_11480 [Acidobacteriota bacterium]
MDARHQRAPLWNSIRGSFSADLARRCPLSRRERRCEQRAHRRDLSRSRPVRGVSRRAGRKPISALVTNFNRTGLTHDELETLLHEFGHVLHGVLSQTEYNLHSGTSVERDFVEAPSQMYEEWGSRMESLSLLRNHCPSCPEVDESLVTRIRAAKKFGTGVDYGRQHLYAAYDMALSGANPGECLEIWKSMETATPMGYIERTSFPGTFEHIASGYAAGYYGYMWAKVIALDLLSAFGEDLMNTATGRRFRAGVERSVFRGDSRGELITTESTEHTEASLCSLW